MDNNITLQTKQMIDNLKAVCTNYGLGNASSEYKIITEVFLYKFLNDKFLAEAKKVRADFENKSSAEIETALAKMSADEYELFLLDFGASVATLKKEHLISYLFNRQNTKDFHKLFDATLIDIANHNIDVFSVHTSGQSKIKLFNGISQHVTEENEKDDFCKAIISKIASHSFEKVFAQKYDFFAQIFEYLIKDYNKDFGKYAEYYTPHSIATIIAKIMVPNGAQNVTVYDPAAGSGTLVLALAHEIGEENCTIFTQDISQKSNEFLRLNLILNNLVHSLPNIIYGDTLTKPYHKNKKGDRLAQFDYIVSNPPFNTDFSDNRDELADGKHKKRFFAGVPKVPEKDKGSMQTYSMFIQHIIYSLEDNGQAAIVVPTPFLTKGKGIDAKIRQKLVDEHMLRAVVTMPNNIFSTTGTSVSILFIQKGYKDSEVLFVEAANLGSKNTEVERNQKTVLSYEEQNNIIETVKYQIEKDNFSIKASFEKIIKSDYRLSPNTYFKHELEYEKIDNHLIRQFFFAKASKLKLFYSKEIEDILDKMFNYWFVDFEFPYGEGTYKSGGGTFEYNEALGVKIPKGWKTKNIRSVCDIVDCLHSKKPNECFEDENYYLLQLDNIDLDGRIDVSEKYYISKSDYITWSSKIEIKEGDFVITNAGRAGAIGTVPKGVSCAIGRNMTAIHPKTIPSAYLRQFLYSPYMQKFVASNLDEGSFFKSLNVKSIKKIEILIPPQEILDKFIEAAGPLVQFVVNGLSIQQEQMKIFKLLDDFLGGNSEDGQILSTSTTLIKQAARSFGEDSTDDTADLVKEFIKRRKNDYKS